MVFKKGNKPWNLGKPRMTWITGLTKETDVRVKKMGESISKTREDLSRRGLLTSWNKGLTKDTDKRVKIISEKIKKYHPIKGKYIKCKICGKDFYIKLYRIGKGKYCSRKCASQRMPSQKSGNGKVGFRKDLNQFFRSTWEANFARILNYWKIPWEYEPIRFNLGDCIYVSDFKVFDPKIKGYYFIEIIGYLDDKHKRKLGLFCKLYPNEKIQIIPSSIYEDLKLNFENKLPNWE